MRTRSWVEINIKALIHNAKTFRKLAPKSELMAIVKSNAYGHGLAKASKAFIQGGATWLGVDSLEEAVLLREEGVSKKIVVLGYVPLAQLEYVFTYKLRPVVYNRETLVRLGALAKKKKKPVSVHLKIETGTNRQGIALKDMNAFIGLFHINKYLKLEGVTTHFANIEDVTKQKFGLLQLRMLHKILAQLKAHNIIPQFVHCAASAAVLAFPESHFNLVRPGFGLYGLWPSEKIKQMIKKRRPSVVLKPALSWKVKIAQIKKVPKGSPIGYGLTEHVRRDSLIAVLPVGYWDGYDRKLSSRGNVLISGRRAKVLGRVCMNMIMVDITDIPRVALEDTAVLIGADRGEVISAEEMAHTIGTISYEVVARINPTLPRIYTK